MTIGIYKGLAFLIKDITKLAKTYVCNDCRGRFTRADHLQRHTKTCSQGETVISCPEEKLKPPLTKYERAFYDKGQASKTVIEWIEKTAKRLGIHIHHALCGHGGERYVRGAPVDGLDPKTGTIFQFHSCWWHGCPRCFTDRDRKILLGKTRHQLYAATMARRGVEEGGPPGYREVGVPIWKDERPFSHKAEEIISACDFDSFFSVNNSIHSYNTRHASFYRLPLCRTNIRQFSISFQGPKFFNTLSSEIKNSQTLMSFKYKLKDFLINNY